MNGELRKRLQLLGSVVSLLLLVALAAAAWFYFQVRASLPQLDGRRALAGLSAAVAVERDALGVPTVRAQTRNDAARALGFVHAQERFFQMDVLRRRAAGELSAVFGKAALPVDRGARWHRFRALAEKVVAALPADQRALVDSYTAGVNAGLAALGHAPFEYTLAGTAPATWQPSDTLLVVYAMTLDLQDANAGYEHSLSVLRDTYGTEGVAFFAPLLTPDDAALDDTRGPLAAVPGPKVIDLRTATAESTARGNRVAFNRLTRVPADVQPETGWPGSNSFAVTGAHTASGAALLANDPHLALRVPNLWYRAVLEWNTTGGEKHRVVGVTIPGLPLVVIGSNGHVAWGLTDAYADTSDLVAVDVNPVAHDMYKVPGRDDLLTIETHRDAIAIKGGGDEVVESRWTVWGPIVGEDSRERPLANHWVTYDPAATNLEFLRLETATDVDQAVAIAHDSGIPPQNFLVADASGSVAWTIAGRLPRRVGFDGRLPVSWSYGDRRWDGYLPPADLPVVIVRAHGGEVPAGASVVQRGALWTANHRMLGGAALAKIGDGGYATPPRAAQIRDQLARMTRVAPKDFLAVQLDDRARFLERWQKLMLDVLTPTALEAKRSRRSLREQVEHWEGRASVDSVSFRLVRAFRNHAAERVIGSALQRCTDAYPKFDWRRFNYEPALWTLLHERPAHVLPPAFASWDDLLLAAVDDVTAELDQRGVAVAHATWGELNRAAIEHPMAHGLPLGFGRWLNLPPDPLPGAGDMPRIQTPDFGASMRLVVAPGHEDEGLFEMPGGQSGNPLSPYYRAGHEAWVHGDPTPLLPGPTQHTLSLVP